MATTSRVFGASQPNASSSATRDSLARSESAERSARRTIFFGVRCA